ncbi:hypothetical protein SSP24_11970 [Streptomyces spinoverrucosus]|uniref:Uncharacterized protein n=1 Tax=Streptomyces spinoverrucosus TaxID=284043 RepID=A0A4Y3V8K4_9ACTN|nr:hypothetical protein [Streptomyces spinoverrucosus]GEC03542.1 hypothetical protein SSP24_11970 [Streptomyces spinoverrucosus]GHB34934.1 hypothetical protein GCM10010397_00600 [Streptomyces spinoverrucosus]
MEPDTPFPPAARRVITVALCGGLALVWLFDLAAHYDPQNRWSSWLPLVSGPLAAAALLFPDRRPGPAWRAGATALGSLALTAGLCGFAQLNSGTWGLLETVALLMLLARTARRVERPATAVATSAALAVAVIAMPLRGGTEYGFFGYSFVLTFAVGGAVGLGCYLLCWTPAGPAPWTPYGRTNAWNSPATCTTSSPTTSPASSSTPTPP